MLCNFSQPHCQLGVCLKRFKVIQDMSWFCNSTDLFASHIFKTIIIREWGFTVKSLLEKNRMLHCLTYELSQLAMSVITKTGLIKTGKNSFFKIGVFQELTSGYFDTGELSQNTINHVTAAKVFPFVGLVSCWLYTLQANCGYQLRYVIVHLILLSYIDKKYLLLSLKDPILWLLSQIDKISDAS